MFTWLSHQRALGELIESVPGSNQISACFVAGATREKAIQEAQRLINRGFSVTLCYLGEEIRDQNEAANATREYQSLVSSIMKASFGENATIAIKPSLLGVHLDRYKAHEYLLGIAESTQEAKMTIEIDMERSDLVDDILALYQQIHSNYPRTVIAIQSYLLRTDSDLEVLLKQKSANIRLVKGGYREHGDHAVQDGLAINSTYHRLMCRLLEFQTALRGVTTRIATHDPSLIGAARTRAMRQQIPWESWEVQMLYGVRPELQQRLIEEGCRVRIVIPYGEHWYPYFLSRLGDHPQAMFSIRDSISRLIPY